MSHLVFHPNCSFFGGVVVNGTARWTQHMYNFTQPTISLVQVQFHNMQIQVLSLYMNKKGIIRACDVIEQCGVWEKRSNHSAWPKGNRETWSRRWLFLLSSYHMFLFFIWSEFASRDGCIFTLPIPFNHLGFPSYHQHRHQNRVPIIFDEVNYLNYISPSKIDIVVVTKDL